MSREKMVGLFPGLALRNSPGNGAGWKLGAGWVSGTLGPCTSHSHACNRCSRCECAAAPRVFQGALAPLMANGSNAALWAWRKPSKSAGLVGSGCEEAELLQWLKVEETVVEQGGRLGLGNGNLMGIWKRRLHADSSVWWQCSAKFPEAADLCGLKQERAGGRGTAPLEGMWIKMHTEWRWRGEHSFNWRGRRELNCKIKTMKNTVAGRVA